MHHDFHDNLYFLNAGRKAFALWPPGSVKRMYTHGALSKAYANGRLVYDGQGDVLTDGTGVFFVWFVCFVWCVMMVCARPQQ